MIFALKCFVVIVCVAVLLTTIDGIEDGWHFLIVGAAISILISMMNGSL